jgi:hypothetical protein
MRRLRDLKKMLEDRRLGFAADEVQTGYHRFEPGLGPTGELPFELRVTWGPRSLLRWIDPADEEFMLHHLEGTVSVGGWAEHIPCRGTLELLYVTKQLIRYTFVFEHRGVSYRWVGEKVNIKLWNLPVSHTTCVGRVTELESGKLISTSVTIFRMRTLPAFLGSFRFA